MAKPSHQQQQQATLTQILISDFHLSEKQAARVVLEHPYEYIIEKINLIKPKKNIVHLGAYFLSAVKKDYKERQTKLPLPSKKVLENSYLREAKEASEIVSLKNKYMSYKLSAYKGFIEQQSKNIQTLIREGFEQFLKPNLEVFRFYKKSGLLSPFVIVDFIKYIDKNYAHFMGEHLSFDDYISSDECELF
jgi:hypothetical protein